MPLRMPPVNWRLWVTRMLKITAEESRTGSKRGCQRRASTNTKGGRMSLSVPLINGNHPAFGNTLDLRKEITACRLLATGRKVNLSAFPVDGVRTLTGN